MGQEPMPENDSRRFLTKLVLTIALAITGALAALGAVGARLPRAPPVRVQPDGGSGTSGGDLPDQPEACAQPRQAGARQHPLLAHRRPGAHRRDDQRELLLP